jgi:hypothetical protein
MQSNVSATFKIVFTLIAVLSVGVSWRIVVAEAATLAYQIASVALVFVLLAATCLIWTVDT